MVTRVKICGLRDPSDAEWAIECGADYLGFVFEPSSPRFVGDMNWSPEWLDSVKAPRVAVFGEVSEQPSMRFDIVQAHAWPHWSGSESRLRFHVLRMGTLLGVDPPDFGEMSRTDKCLLDAYDARLHGGSGKVIDWDVAAMFVKEASVDVILAGGLTPDNVAEAIQKVRPYAVDVSSGVESSPGIKDHIKMRDFIQAAKGA